MKNRAFVLSWLAIILNDATLLYLINIFHRFLMKYTFKNIIYNNGPFYRTENHINKLRLYNMLNVGEERRWLQDILLSDTSDSSSDEDNEENPITEDDFQDMLKFHILRKKYQAKFYQKPEVSYAINTILTNAMINLPIF